MKNLTTKQLESISGAGFFDYLGGSRGGAPLTPLTTTGASGNSTHGGFNIAVTPPYPNNGFGVSIGNTYNPGPTGGTQWNQPTIGASWTWRW